MHCDFTTPKACKITPSDEKIQRGEQEKGRCIRGSGRKNKADISFNFYIVYFGVSGRKKKKKFDISDFNTVFINPGLLIDCIFG